MVLEGAISISVLDGYTVFLRLGLSSSAENKPIYSLLESETQHHTPLVIRYHYPEQ